jgi:translation elongation factor EF-G
MLSCDIFYLPTKRSWRLSSSIFRLSKLPSGTESRLESAVGICKCYPKVPLVLHVSKMLPSSEEGRLYALGHIFSGSISAGCKVRVQGPNNRPGNFRRDLYLTIQARRRVNLNYIYLASEAARDSRETIIIRNRLSSLRVSASDRLPAYPWTA